MSNTRSERLRYYKRCVHVADAAGVPVSQVMGHLREYLDRLGTVPCVGRCGKQLRAAYGKRLCADCLKKRKQERDRQRWKARLVGDPHFVFVDVPVVECADCGGEDVFGMLHLVTLALFCPTCCREIISLRNEKGTAWDI